MSLNVNDVTTLNETFSNSKLNLFAKLFDFIKNTDGLDNSADTIEYIKQLADVKYKLDPTLYTMALSEKDKSFSFMDRVLYQSAYNSFDFTLFYKFLKYWYSSNRTLVTSVKNMNDVYYLSTEEIDELIKSFGFPYPNKIISKRSKVSFLYNLIDYYKHKGTPYVFGESLQYFGLKDVTVSEWWLKKEQSTGELFFQSKPVYPYKNITKSEFINKIYWDDYFDSLTDVHWYQTKAQINSAYLNTNITLPSITPFITLHMSFDIMRMSAGISVIQEWMQETYTFWLEYVLKYTKDNNYDGENVTEFVNDPSYVGTVGETYVVGDSPVGTFVNYPCYYIKYTSLYGWIPKKPKTNDLIFVNSTSTHWIYNGVSWCDLGYEIDSTLLSQSKHGEINRPISISGFSSNFSIWEIMLAIGYLFDSSNDTTDTRYIYYNGIYSPLDKEISGIRDNVVDDSDVYNKIYTEYDSYSHYNSIADFTRTNRDANYAARYQKFQGSIDKTSKDNVLHTLYNPGLYLEVLNPYIKEKLDEYKVSSNFNELFGDLLIGFESYAVDNSKIIDLPFVFFLFNSYAYASFKKLIDFWKPYRSRIYSFEHRIGINDRTENSQLEEDELCKKVVIYLCDQAPGRETLYDSSTVTDELTVTVRYVI